MQLQKGKLYQVKALHPDKVFEPFDMGYYPAEILKGGHSVKILVDKRGRLLEDIFLKKGDINMYLGNLVCASGRYMSSLFSVILFNGRIYRSNCPIEKTHLYYEMERVG